MLLIFPTPFAGQAGFPGLGRAWALGQAWTGLGPSAGPGRTARLNYCPLRDELLSSEKTKLKLFSIEDSLMAEAMQDILRRDILSSSDKDIL